MKITEEKKELENGVLANTEMLRMGIFCHP
jgi:hypothetical protein